MSNSKTTIELNGKRYDARTGKILDDSVEAQPIIRNLPKKQSRNHAGQVLDGFVRSAPSQQNQTQQNTSSNPATSSLRANFKRADSSTSVKNTQRKLSKSQTLMRPAVKKPHLVKNDIQAVKYITKPAHAELARGARAEAAKKSPLVSRYGNYPKSSVIKTEAHLAVISPNLSASVPQMVNHELQRLEHALQDATSHMHQLEDNMLKKAHFLERFGFKNKAANITAMSCAFLLLAGFFAYQNMAAISMKVAASRSGVQAQLPGYSPAGYGVAGSVKSEPGKVTVSFKSRTDSKGYTITQESSNWNSATLLANNVTKTHCNTCYQTWQNDGKTVFIYDNSNATWVSGGVWYQVEGNADLTSDQLLKLANSL